VKVLDFPLWLRRISSIFSSSRFSSAVVSRSEVHIRDFTGTITARRVAGAIAGLVAGALGATAYAFHCPDNSVPFVAIWYSTLVALCGVIGAILGPPASAVVVGLAGQRQIAFFLADCNQSEVGSELINRGQIKPTS
jgi:hypothetical protein